MSLHDLGLKVTVLPKVGDLVRSFDFARPGETWGRELEGERAGYVEGIVEKIAPYEDCAPFCYHLHIRCTKRVLGGVEWPEDIGRLFYPVADRNQSVVELLEIRSPK